MKRSDGMRSFVLGFLITSITATVIHVRAQSGLVGGGIHACVASNGVMRMVAPAATCASGERSLGLRIATPDAPDSPKPTQQPLDASIDQAILNDLSRRLLKLENMDCGAIGKNKVAAPFQVFDRTGKKVLYVDGSALALFNSGGKAVAKMIADRAGGLFTAEGESTSAFFGINDPELAGVGVRENGQRRIAFGRNLRIGTYSLVFRSSSDQQVAGIGVSLKDNAGVAQVNMAGMTKANIGLTNDGRGIVEILGGNSIAQLTESAESHGGKLWIGNAGGMGMVEAGDAGGYGIVKAGPLGFEFIPTPGLALPASVIVGR
jgi:hypothetical protein